MNVTYYIFTTQVIANEHMLHEHPMMHAHTFLYASPNKIKSTF